MITVILGCMTGLSLSIILVLKLNPDFNFFSLMKVILYDRNRNRLVLMLLISLMFSAIGVLVGYGVALLIGALTTEKEFSLVEEQIIVPVTTKTFPDKKFFLQDRSNYNRGNFLVITKKNNRLRSWELQKDQVEIYPGNKKPAVMQIFSNHKFSYWGITQHLKKYKIFITPDSILYVPDVEE